MIRNIQIAMFFMLGAIAWQGVDEAVESTKIDAQYQIIKAMPIESLQQIDVREL